MAVYAAMVDNMDRQIGRVLDHLQKTGELDNTVVVFLSDNGADGNSVYDVGRTREWIHQDMDNSTANIGRPGSFIEYGPGWAQVGMTPFNLYKSFMYEGGISVPAIVWAPGQGVLAQRRTQVGHVMDIAPTLYELAGATHPAAKGHDAKGNAATTTEAKAGESLGATAAVLPVKGRSLLAFLQGRTPSAYSPDDAIGWELGGRKALRKGDWKIVYANSPLGQGRLGAVQPGRGPHRAERPGRKAPGQAGRAAGRLAPLRGRQRRAGDSGPGHAPRLQQRREVLRRPGHRSGAAAAGEVTPWAR
jgi:arylsulfatase